MNNSDKLKQEINNKCMEIIKKKEVYIIKYMFIIIYIYCLFTEFNNRLYPYLRMSI